METSWHNYPKVFALGHRAVNELFDGEVLVEEKVDGSQFSFGRFGGVLRVRSHGKEMIADAPESLFKSAVGNVASLPLHDGWTYRGECLTKPKHNTLKYDRVPTGNVILFDINTDHEEYLPYDQKQAEAERLGLEIVPLMYCGIVTSPEQVYGFLERQSILGGTKIEGVVIKNYAKFGEDKKVLMGKYVSEAFKEEHKKVWGESNPTGKDIVAILIGMLKTDARWQKAVQHLREDGKLEDSPRDIGNLILAVKQDIKDECADEIKAVLYKWAIDHVIRGCVRGLPEWYKQRLLESQSFNL